VQTLPLPLSPADQMVGILLGLGDLTAVRGCWGFQHCCNCPDCMDRETCEEQLRKLRQAEAA
jgi:hypothetical protein